MIPRRSRWGQIARRALEEMYMRAMAELDAEDTTLDDGAIKIADDDVFVL